MTLFSTETLEKDGTREILEKLEAISSSDKNKEISEKIRKLMESKALYPLTNREQLEAAMATDPDIAELFGLVMELSGRSDYGEIPGPEGFTVIDEPYRGANGKDYHPLPKYLPNHIVPYLHQMQVGFKEFLDEHPEYVGPNGRPGLVVMSGFRSHYYQVAIFARSILNSGLDRTLASAMLPGGISDHANYDNCGIDWTNIGNQDGAPNPNQEIDLMDTVEFAWLLEHSAEYGFAFPYPPKIDNPADKLSPSGVLIEPWHVKFVGNSETISGMYQEMHTVEAFKARASLLGAAIVKV